MDKGDAIERGAEAAGGVASKLLPIAEWRAGATPVVLVACGSFSPVTLLHLRMFEVARDAIARHPAALQVVGGLLSPVADGYAKAGLAPASDRLAMLRLATASNALLGVDAWEAGQGGGAVRTVLVLASVRERLARALPVCPRVILLAGLDLVQTFDRPGCWLDEDVEEIAAQYGIAVLDRTADALAAAPLGAPALRAWLARHRILSRHLDRILVVEQDVPNATSSTLVRRLVAEGRSIRYLVPDGVAEYVEGHGLFR